MAGKIIPETALAAVRDRESLFAFLRDHLRWPVAPEDTFTYTGPQLHGEAAARVEVSQIVPFTSNDPFLIMLAEFQSKFRRSDLREILRAIKAEIRTRGRYGDRSLEDIIFACATENYNGIRFAHFKEQEGRQPRMSVFGWDRDDVEATRTLRDINLRALYLPLDQGGQPDWNLGEDTWLGAWDVEAVTREFFREYREVFEKVEEMITRVKGDKRLFTQRLFNRLLFIQFLQKKRWLRFEGSTKYLPALFQAAKIRGENFYTDRLYWLFFYGLGTLTDSQFDSKETIDAGVPPERRGEVPYLNGGLFEMEDADDVCGAASIDNKAFELIIHGLFERYNFTVTESTPFDVEVAVDPEMLGKVFEELVTGRHETGSYCTPKPIVSFMCREALKGYLQSALPKESEEAVQRFVDEHDPEGLHDPEAALEALKRVRACDPACGSGAYLLGMLHELLDLRACLFAAKSLDPVTVYERKLEIIQNSLYGVDNDPFAVNIARLRLWLSLVVEYEGDSPPPLPNLDFKIEQGDSLTAPDPSGGKQPDIFRRQQMEEFHDLKGRYMVAHGTEKSALRRLIDELKEQICAWAHQGLDVTGFDWQVEFAEVMSDGGFDIVLANPPYVRQELIKDIKPALKRTYGDLYCGTADLYVYFYYRALQLLKQGGMLAFISSNKWFKAGYGEKLRKHLGEICAVRGITDFRDLPVFHATAYPMVFMAQKGGVKSSARLTIVTSLEPPYPDVAAVVATSGHDLPQAALTGSNWTFADRPVGMALQKVKSTGIPLVDYLGKPIYRGIVTGLNQAFVLDSRTREQLIRADPRSAQIIKRLVTGRDIRRWAVDEDDKWLIVTPIGVDIGGCPAVLAHLKKWQAELERRCDQGNYWWELRACDYYDEFQRPKIVFPDITRESRFAYEARGAYATNTTYFLPTADFYLLGLLNSKTVELFYRELSAQIRGGYLRFFRQYVEQIPIPKASEAERSAVAELVQKCIDAKGVGCKEWEREIDERVAGLYGL